jgi:serine protease AprX
MHCPTSTRPVRLRTTLLLALLALVVVLFPFASLPTQPAAVARAHPALLALAGEDPAQVVSVIVQQAEPSAELASVVARLGGEVTYDFPFLQGFAAELPAQAALVLAERSDVRWVAVDAPVIKTNAACPDCIDTANLFNTYIESINADDVWNSGPAYLQGQDVTVAVIDSGMNPHLDAFNADGGNGSSRIIANHTFAWGSTYGGGWDQWGHGTHVAGIIGGNGASSDGQLIGVAPKVNLIDLKVGDGKGYASVADVVAAIQWVYDNAESYNIRVVNLSLSSTMAESYHTSALNAAVELLWFRGITVVVAGGNDFDGHTGIGYAPANDPFVISVGAVNEQGTPDPSDDELAGFTSHGITDDGFAKPDLVAPGVDIVGLLASRKAIIVKEHPELKTKLPGVRGDFLRLSGTSMSSAVVAGAAALLIQAEPELTPDQVKARLMVAARSFSDDGWTGAYLDVEAAVNGTTIAYANQDVVISQLLWFDGEPVAWDAANWSAANWSAANWSAANWSAANWSAANWSTIDLGNDD